MLCAPAVIAMLAVTAYPIGYAFVLSLQKLDLRFPEQTEFVGLANYGTVLSSELWWTDLFNTVFIMVDLGRDRAGAGDGDRAGHAPGDLRPRRGPHRRS